MFSRMSLDAKPRPVDRPAKMASSHDLPTWNIVRAIISQMPHTNTCSTFLIITILLAADEGSCFSKWWRISSVEVMLMYLKMK